MQRFSECTCTCTCSSDRRRRLLKMVAPAFAIPLSGAGPLAWAADASRAEPGKASVAVTPPLTRPLPDGTALPVIGMGSWITFNVGNDEHAIAERTRVLRSFFDHGGGMIDSSPMYGSSEAVIGRCLTALEHPGGLFAASKIWTSSPSEGREQWQDSRRLWGLDTFGLMQVHNLVAWREQLAWLADEKAAGRVRLLGVTTSHGRRHDLLAKIIGEAPIDCVQLSYSVVNRAVEERLLPMAAQRGIAVIVNRPFVRGELPRRLRGAPLPGWAAEIDCQTWAQALLKWIVSNPLVSCAIPATSQADHMAQNMSAARGPMPDAALRARIAADVARLI